MVWLRKEHDPIKSVDKAGEDKAILVITKSVSTTKREHFVPGQQERCVEGKFPHIKTYKNIGSFERRLTEKST